MGAMNKETLAIWADVEAKRIVDRLYKENPTTLIDSIELHENIKESLLRAIYMSAV